MEKSEIIELIKAFKEIEIYEEDVSTPEEKESGQLVLVVTYKYQGKEYKTEKLYYKDISRNKEAKKIVDYFGSPVFWLDMDNHQWPSKEANLNNSIIPGIAQKGDTEFQEFLKKLANDSKEGIIFRIMQRDGYWANYHFNLLNNNHWHDIVKLILAFINSKGENVDKSFFSKLVFRWEQTDEDDPRSSLSYAFGDRNFIKELQKNIKMVQQELQKEEIKILLEKNFQIILQGPPGTGKTRLAKEIAYSLIEKESLPNDENERTKKLKELSESEQYKLIQFHPSYSYEDFVRGITAKAIGEKISYEVENRVLAEMAANACKSNKPFVLIIDEINRANLPTVLGELIYALEYRGEPVESMYALIEDGNGIRKLILPKNLYIIGTMNTADRSVGNIDYALRRRFVFETIPPDENVIIDAVARNKFKEVDAIFTNFPSPEFEKKDVMIGHSYFLGDDWKNKLKYQVKPLLREYIKDGVLNEKATDDIEKLTA